MNSPFPNIPIGKRRLRRNPHRDNHSVYTSNRNMNNDDDDKQERIVNSIVTDGNMDLIQTGQMIKVRWKYEDDAPRQILTNDLDAGTYKMNYEDNQLDKNGSQNSIKMNISQRSNDIPPSSSFKSPGVHQQHQVVGGYSTLKPTYVISFTGLPSDERDYYAEIVERLGGEVDNQTTLSERTTHLIVHTPTRSEKCLICLASGKWMLHKSYLDACSRESRWVDEIAYEWGGPGTEPLLMQLSPFPRPGIPLTHQQQQAAQIRDLARSARRWRLAGGKAFNNWKVIFGPGCDKESSFRRVIEAGGGKVLANSPPFPSVNEVTHAFFNHVAIHYHPIYLMIILGYVLIIFVLILVLDKRFVRRTTYFK
ncbi:unnamed protein product [Heterobilharzia americana]|nr:unnamed protein product [Heterobilharzia americana]